MAGATAYGTHHIFYRRIFAHHFHHPPQLFVHRLKRSGLVGADIAHQHAGVLLREKAFGNLAKQPNV